ncbi:MAG: TolC family protein [Desulfovibrionaceae bacterium]|nr:TolC family protein [Desulfovibrionaceae bacterium]
MLDTFPFRGCLPLVLLTLLSGCATPFPQQLQDHRILSAEQIAEQYDLNPQWWHIYRQNSLNTLIDTALERNADLAKSIVAVSRALYNAGLLTADLLPSFAGSGQGEASKDLHHGGPSSRLLRGEISLNYELDLWRRLRHAKTAADWEYSATAADLEEVRLAVIKSTADSWFKLLYYRDAIRFTEVRIQRYARLLDILQRKHQAGKTDLSEPMLAEQSLLAAQRRLADLRKEEENTLENVKNLLNLSQETAWDLPAASLTDLVPRHDAVCLDVPISALAARPDVRAAEDRLKKAFYNLEDMRMSWFPSVSIGSVFSVSGVSLSTLDQNPNLGGLLNFKLPFLDWNRVRLNIAISKADFQTAQLNFEQAVTSALNETAAAFIRLKQDRLLFENWTRRQITDHALSEYYGVRYREGASELKDWLEALNTEDETRLSSLEAAYNVITSVNAVFRSMGGRYEPKSAGKQTQFPQTLLQRSPL